MATEPLKTSDIQAHSINSPFNPKWISFITILYFITLAIFAVSLGAIFHFWIEKTFPIVNNYPYSDTLNYFYYLNFNNNDLLRSYIATLMISYPLFMVLQVIINENLTNHQNIRNLLARKICIYITLIAAFLVMIGSTSAGLYGYLDGNALGNSLGHTIITDSIAGIIFLIFLRDFKKIS